MMNDVFESEKLDETVQICGLIRFSFPTVGGYKTNPESYEEKLAMLYAPERMEQRFEYFEKLCLHTLIRQTNQNFSLGILVGRDMPKIYRDKLDHLLKDLPQAKVIEKPIIRYRAAVRQAFEGLFDSDYPFRFTFRLDDDDAVATDYIERVRASLPQLLLMSGGFDQACLSFSQGLILHGEGLARQFTTGYERSPLGLGLGLLAPSDTEINIYRYNHMLIHTKMPSLIDPGPMMMLRTFHLTNDSEAMLMPSIKIDMSDVEIAAVLKDRFDLEVQDVLAL